MTLRFLKVTCSFQEVLSIQVIYVFWKFSSLLSSACSIKGGEFDVCGRAPTGRVSGCGCLCACALAAFVS